MLEIITTSIKQIRTSILFFTVLIVLGILAIPVTARAEVEATQDLVKASQNPISTLISVPFENNTTFNNGTEDPIVNILNIKPVVPLSIGENWNLINRLDGAFWRRCGQGVQDRKTARQLEGCWILQRGKAGQRIGLESAGTINLSVSQVNLGLQLYEFRHSLLTRHSFSDGGWRQRKPGTLNLNPFN